MGTAGRAADAISRAGFPLVEDAARRPKALILDVFGAYVREIGGWIRVADLVRLMGSLGVDEPGTRAAVARMLDGGLLEREKRGTQRGYRLTGTALELLEDADRRIFATTTAAALSEGWLLVSFSVPETLRSQRHLLRSRLTWLGFGNLTSGLWVAPARLQRELETTIESLALTRYVDYFVATYHGFEAVSDMVARSWDLDELRKLYEDFLGHARPVLHRWRGAGLPPDADAFVDYTVTLQLWRRFPYLDPGLPTEVLPRGWAGKEARALFLELHRLLQPRALRHVRAVTGGDAG
ncbi:PaaX family transcriptional regulator [Micromonospora marina]|uniref:PaaX family transcriptional regulator n=1 Tax=Micromonospora marina TaxID=307120 RepID=UPI0034523E36